MSKDKQLYPKVRFNKYEDEWEQKKLGEISTIVGGGTPKQWEQILLL